MKEGTRIIDRFGLPISTSSTVAAERCQEAADLILSRNYGPEERLGQAIEADEGFALAHCCLAQVSMLRGRVAEAKESAERARSLAAGTSNREQQQIEAVALWVNGQGTQSLALIREHLKEYPRNQLMLAMAQRLFMLGCSSVGVPNFPEELFALCQSVERQCSDDWSFLGQYSFAHHETGKLDEAMRLSERSMEMMPSNGVASHSVAHVYFERGDASGGGSFLSNWLDSYDKRGPSTVHLFWHQALFELAMGRYQGALDIYETEIRPTVAANGATALNDSASLVWRLQLYAGTPPLVPLQEVSDLAAPAAVNPGPAFRDAHAALAFAAAGDEGAMGRMLDRLRGAAEQGNVLAGEVILPMVQGIAAFAEGNYSQAVASLEPLAGQFVRIGGSHAQREVFEDTLLEAFLRAEQFDKAEAMLTERLSRRESVRDTFWLGRVQASNGQQEAAKSALEQAKNGWEGADRDTAEFANLTNLTTTLG